MITVEVTKKSNENTQSLLRRFTRKVKTSGILRTVRGKRFYARKNSHFKLKARALTNMQRKVEIEKLKKLGKFKD